MTASNTTEITGMRAFFVVWGGQLISVIGTSVTGFALQFWVFLETGSVTQLAMVTLAVTLPATLLSPVAGALVDRWDRRLVMIGADTLAGAATLLIAFLYFTDALEIWHIYLTAGIGAIGNAFQSPAWLAAMPTLVPKKHLARANGMTQLIEGVAFVLGPLIAGALLALSGLGAILILDLTTFAIAVGALVAVRFPRVERTERGSIRAEIRSGWGFLRDRTGMMWLLWMYAGVNFVMSFTNVLIIPMILSFASESTAGTIFSIGGLGLVAGSLLVSIWGGFKNRIASITMGITLVGLLIALSGIRPNAVIIGAGFVLMLFTIPFVNTASQVLWQLKVPLGMQGRVFALRRTVASAMSPLAILAAGPLADKVFEPLLAPDGALGGSVGSVIGTGPGRGIAFLVIVSGLMTAMLGQLGWLHPRVRNLETELPDIIPDAVGVAEPAPV
jgi:DHA3 family macrolide efflux protein-like MFS transporter